MKEIFVPHGAKSLILLEFGRPYGQRSSGIPISGGTYRILPRLGDCASFMRADLGYSFPARSGRAQKTIVQDAGGKPFCAISMPRYQAGRWRSDQIGSSHLAPSLNFPNQYSLMYGSWSRSNSLVSASSFDPISNRYLKSRAASLP